MQLGITAIFLSVLVYSAWASDDLPEIPTLDTKGMTLYEVTRVVDGDSIKVDYEGETRNAEVGLWGNK